MKTEHAVVGLLFVAIGTLASWPLASQITPDQVASAYDRGYRDGYGAGTSSCDSGTTGIVLGQQYTVGGTRGVQTDGFGTVGRRYAEIVQSLEKGEIEFNEFRIQMLETLDATKKLTE